MRKNQAIRLYLFLASAKIPQRFSSRRRLLLHHTRNKKDTASILCRVQRMPSMASAEHEFACRKLTALTGGQWFTAKSSLQCKLEVKECTGRTFFNDDIRVRSESAHPCIGFVSSFFHKLDNLKEDRLLEKGKHAELLEKTGYYTKLWNAQIEA